MLSYQKSGHVNLRFVVHESCNSEDDSSDEMKMAFQECSEADLSPEWISEKQCMSLSYTKMDVFVLQEFTGKVFNRLRSTKSVVCGPVCLRTCLAEGAIIPENNSPVYTTAMRNFSITASNTAPQRKAKIKEKVGFMGGIYTSNLVEATTHLVTNAVRSAKYEKATEKGITVMTEEWIDAVWRTSLKKNIKADDAEFDVYKCKIFQDLQLTCSNLSRVEKEKIKKLVTENGGIFTPQLHQNTTSLVIISAPHGDKYKYANSWKLPCVYPSWIMESVEKGYAVPTTKHLLSTEMKCSTPTSSEPGNFTLGAAQISLISHDIDQSRVSETLLPNATVFSGRESQMQQLSNSEGVTYKQILENLNVATAKRAGLFVDGCKIFLSGFHPQEVEKLRRLLSLGGASIFKELSETVSYVIVGDHVANDVKAISNMTRRPYVVSLEWLAASIKQRGPASGDVHSCLDQMNIPVEPPSPLSQKGLQLLQPVEGNKQDSSAGSCKVQTPQPVSRKLFKDFAKPEGVGPQTMNSHSLNNTQDSQTSLTQEESQVTEFFRDLSFKIHLDDDDHSKEMEKVITTCGGLVVGSGFKGVPDYSIVPLNGEVRHVTAPEIVTYLWVEDCYYSEECLNVEYYHQPFTIHSAKKPLEGCCLSTTNYTGKEKIFLTLLGEALGAICQDVFARKVHKAKNIFASTHLISPAPTGTKYEAAMKWNVPSVSKDWLLACAKNGVKVPEKPYLVANNTSNASAELQEKEDQIMGPPVDVDTHSPNVSRDCPKPLESTTNVPHSAMAPPKCAPSTMKPSLNSAGSSFGHANFLQYSTESPSFGHSSVGAQSSRGLPNRITPCKRKSSCTPDHDTDVSPFHVDTPDTPYGQVFETPTRSSKKRWKKFVDNIGRFAKEVSPPVKPQRKSTPMTELRAQMWKKFIDLDPQNVDSTSDQNAIPSSSSGTPGDRLTQHLERLGEQLANHTPPEPVNKWCQDSNTIQPPLNTPLNPSTSKPIPKPGVIDSQPITIDWEDPIEIAERLKLNKMKRLGNPTKTST